MTDSVTIHEAKTHLSKLVARVEAGEEFIVRRGKVPVAMLVRYEPPPRVRTPGAWKGPDLDGGRLQRVPAAGVLGVRVIDGVLLDTQALLYWLGDEPELPVRRARAHRGRQALRST